MTALQNTLSLAFALFSLFCLTLALPLPFDNSPKRFTSELSPAPSVTQILPRTGGEQDRKCLHDFEACHERSIDLTARLQRLVLEESHLNHTQAMLNTLSDGQACGKKHELYELWLNHLYGGGKRTRARDEPPRSPESKISTSSTMTTTHLASATATNKSQVSATPYNSTTTEWCAKEKACVANARQKELELAGRQAYIERIEIQNTQVLSVMASCAWTSEPSDGHRESEAAVHRREAPNKAAMLERVRAWSSSCEVRLKQLQIKETKVKQIKERAESYVAGDMLHDRDVRTRTTTTALPLDIAEPHTLVSRKGEDWEARIREQFEAWERCKDNIVTSQNSIETEFGLIADAQDRYVAELNPIHTKRGINHQDSAASLSMSSGNLSVRASEMAQGHDDDHWRMWETGYGRLNIVENFWELQYGVVFASLLDKYGRLAETNWHLAQFTREKMKKMAEDYSRSVAPAAAATVTSSASESKASPTTSTTPPHPPGSTPPSPPASSTDSTPPPPASPTSAPPTSTSASLATSSASTSAPPAPPATSTSSPPAPPTSTSAPPAPPPASATAAATTSAAALLLLR